MQQETIYDVIVVGGSFAGLSAALSLGRSMRRVLVIDSGNPCNKQTPHSHNFLTHDGEPPMAIAAKARKELEAYPTVYFLEDKAHAAGKTEDGFRVTVSLGTVFHAKKLLFATGVKDLMPAIPGYAQSWGISVLHCPYCHGYEVRDQPTAILADGDHLAFEKAKMIAHWTKELVFLTNGSSTLSAVQREQLIANRIDIIEKEIKAIVENKGHVSQVTFTDGSSYPVKAIYSRPEFEQHSLLPLELGCALTESGHIQTDEFKRTTVPGVYAAGDNTTAFRSVAGAVAAGSSAGAFLNKELIDEAFLR
jgi:thioredoxin reductase